MAQQIDAARPESHGDDAAVSARAFLEEPEWISPRDGKHADDGIAARTGGCLGGNLCHASGHEYAEVSGSSPEGGNISASCHGGGFGSGAPTRRRVKLQGGPT